MMSLQHSTSRVACTRGQRCQRMAQPVARVSLRSQRTATRVLAAFSPPTVADTKKKFINDFKKPIPALYNTVIQELLVQMHFVHYAINYEYNSIYALGFVSVFDQITESLPEDERKQIFRAYIDALGDKPEKFRKDAELLEKEASALPGPEALIPDANGTALQKTLARVKERSDAGNFNYNKFFAIGLFRLLELTGAKEPAALERLVKSVGVKPEAVNRDLMLYKGILSKLNAAKELMKEFIAREKKKQAEREAEKTAKAAAASESEKQAETVPSS